MMKTRIKKSLSALEFKPLFVKDQKKAKSYFKWRRHHCEIRGIDGRVYFSMKNVKAPEQWSNTAIDIAASKYFRKSVKRENSIEALIERVGEGLRTAVVKSKYFASKKQQDQFVEEVKYILYSQKAAFNSPVWFNLGLKECYGLISKSEHFAWNEEKNQVEPLRDAYLRPQTSACFIQSVEDNLESIFDLVKSEAKLFKYGSGSGTNFSNLRSRFENLSSGGTSSGLISFLEVLDRAAGAIKSGGTTRRAAKMVCLDLDHPEVEDFIRWKWHEEKKAKELISLGYSADLDGEAYKTVAGQNANNSVRVPDRFMKKLGQGETWDLRERSTGKVIRRVSVDQLWQLICEAAWHCADPGLQFDDQINRFHTCSKTDRIYASNPCSEYMFLDNSACNLASLNLIHFIDRENRFKLNEFLHVVRTLLIAQECLVDHSSYPTKTIAQNSHDYRTLGLGFANLGSFFMRQAMAYDSPQARAWAGAISSLMAGQAYLTSAEMAQVKKPFAGFKKNKISMLKVISRHRKAAQSIEWSLVSTDLQRCNNEIWQNVFQLGKKSGYRNAQVTVIAPTGTIGLVMDCDTTGIEPDFSLTKNKKLSGGGYLQIVNQSVPAALKILGYSDAEVEKIEKQLVTKGMTLNECSIRPEHKDIFACATGDRSLAAKAHLLMMAAVQPFISGAISKTVNLPGTATIQDISETYQAAWRLGLKSVAVYRDGSKAVQPLNSGTRPTSQQEKNTNPACTECGYPTVLESGCYRCINCGTTTACAS